MTYEIDYSNSEARQRFATPKPADDTRAPVYRERRAPFAVPSIIKTGATILMTGACFFAFEAFAPTGLRPSTLMGTYDARVESAVKAAELTQQAKFERYAADVKVSVEQQSEQYKAFNQAVLQRYGAAWERGKIWATATAQLQSQYVAARLAQRQSTQGTDVAIVNYARLFGRLGNILEPGAGDAALDYANKLSDELSEEIDVAAANGQTIRVDGWDAGITSIEELRSEIAALKPITVPLPPKFGEDAGNTSIAGYR